MKEKSAKRFMRRKAWKLTANRTEEKLTRLETDEMKVRKVLGKQV